MEKKFLIGRINQLAKEYKCPSLRVFVTESFMVTVGSSEVCRVHASVQIEDENVVLLSRTYKSYIDFMNDLQMRIDIYFKNRN